MLTLFAAAESRGQIITNTDLELSGFTVAFTSDSKPRWDIDNNGNYEVQFEFTSSYRGLTLNLAQNSFGFVGTAGSGHVDRHLRNLALSPSPETISANSKSFFDLGFVIQSGEFDNVIGFTSGERGYMGFRYKSATSSDTMLYGWAAVTFTTGESASFTLHEWAYDNSGASIQVGQTAASAIPEPANVAVGLGALALGAAGLMRWRKRKAA